jgi:SAM-dependent methyltransferase
MSTDEELALDTLSDRYYAAGDATRKGNDYMRSYARLLGHRRHEPLRILELGVGSGASLLIWRDYLPRAIIVGVDVAEPPPRIVNQERIHFVHGGQDDPLVLGRAASLAGGGFDLIVDDASHIGYLTKRSFLWLFPRFLMPGGCYVIEDFGTSFLAEYPDGAAFAAPDWRDAAPGTLAFGSTQLGMVGVLKQLLDHMMQEMMTGVPSFLPIVRVTLEPNIAFIEKSMRASRPPPDALPDTNMAESPAPHWDEVAAQVRLLADRVTGLEQSTNVTIQAQADRIARLDATLDRLLRGLAPLRWVWRTVRGSRARPRDG